MVDVMIVIKNYNNGNNNKKLIKSRNVRQNAHTLTHLPFLIKNKIIYNYILRLCQSYYVNITISCIRVVLV